MSFPGQSRVHLFAAMLGVTVAVTAAPLTCAAEPPRTVVLHNGSTVHGEILQRSETRIVVDLGYTVLSIPADEIERIVDFEEPAVDGDEPETYDLYQIASGRRELTVKENVDRCGEAVVEVRTSIGLGSGFIIHPEGYVVTSHHVISGERRLTVTLFEKTDRELQKVQFENVRIVAMNPHLDLTLLKIEDRGGRELPTVPLGDSSALRQGQTVFGIGSPLGFDRTVSQGIVSLKNRPLGGHIYVQSTAQINPGNSGGPLFNLRGEVVGVNDLKISAEGLEGLGFAIPSNVLREFLANRNAFAFDVRNPNAGFRYNEPPASTAPLQTQQEESNP